MKPCNQTMQRRCKVSRAAIILIFAVTVLLSGCASLDQMIQQPTATFREMKLVDASLIQSTATFHFSVDNPNPVTIRTSRIAYDLTLNGRHFVRGELDKGLTLAAGGKSPMAIPITIKYLDLYDSLRRMLASGRAQYDLRGHFNIGPFTIPYQAQGEFDLPEMPKITLETIHIRQLSPSGATLNCRLRLENPNDFPLNFNRLNCRIQLNGKPLAKAGARSRGAIGRKGHAVLDVDMAVSFAQMGLSAYQMLQSSKADYQMNGQLWLDSPSGKNRALPFDLSGRVPFTR